MKTLNSGMKMSTMTNLNDEHMPCWYANFEPGKTRKGSVWKVGVNGEKKEEHSFKASKFGDISKDTVWKHIHSVDFAVELINKFREGGQKAVKRWISQGCP